jgi:glycerol uptake facilitator-like aquaporin
MRMYVTEFIGTFGLVFTVGGAVKGSASQICHLVTLDEQDRGAGTRR